MMTSFHTQRGLTLLEMLLAVGVIGIMMVMVSRVTSEAILQRDAQAAGEQMARMSQITEDVLLRTNPDMTGFTSYSAKGATTGGAGNINKALANNGYDLDNANFKIARRPVDVIFALNLAGGGPGSAMFLIRTIVVLKEPLPVLQALKIARAMGSRGGVIRSDSPNEIVSAFGNWTYPVSVPIASRLALPVPAADQAYVVAYRAIAPTDSRGPYVDVYGNNGGNVMHTDLLMNGNSIVKIKDIDAGTVTATKAARFDQLAVNGTATFQGGVDAQDAVSVEGDVTVEKGNLSVASGNLEVPGGNVSAKGLRADTLEAEELTTTDLSAKTLTVEGGDTLVTSNLTVSGGATLDITGPLKATVVDADDITTDTLKTTTMNVKEKTTLSGETTINNTANVDQLVLDGCMVLQGVAYPVGCAP
jgi:prepilin-type N-terminal cleavage/methylation domain-containing protein